MDFRLSDEQRMLRRTIRDLVDKEIKPRSPEWDRNQARVSVLEAEDGRPALPHAV